VVRPRAVRKWKPTPTAMFQASAGWERRLLAWRSEPALGSRSTLQHSLGRRVLRARSSVGPLITALLGRAVVLEPLRQRGQPGRDRIHRGRLWCARLAARCPSDAVDLGGFDGFVEAERRQDCRKKPSQQRLSASGRANHQQVVVTNTPGIFRWKSLLNLTILRFPQVRRAGASEGEGGRVLIHLPALPASGLPHRRQCALRLATPACHQRWHDHHVEHGGRCKPGQDDQRHGCLNLATRLTKRQS
jgi:hypothetical protein